MLMQTDKETFVQGVIHEMGEVERSQDAGVVVSTPSGFRRARIAASCLVRPATGDTVLLAGRGADCFVLSVLVRHGGEPLELHFDRDTQLSVQGRLDLHCEQAGTWSSGEQVRVEAPTVAVRAEEVEIVGARVSIAAQALGWLADTLESTSRWCRQVADVWSVRARQHQREVDEMELVRTGHLDVHAQELMNLRARHTVVRSDELTKVDGKQIQVG